eukprot:jgi/Mesen1/1554/ME000134S00672
MIGAALLVGPTRSAYKCLSSWISRCHSGTARDATKLLSFHVTLQRQSTCTFCIDSNAEISSGRKPFFSLATRKTRSLEKRTLHGRAVYTDTMTTPPSSKLLSQIFWNEAQREALAALYHPFVIGLAAETLPKAGFWHFIAQDVYYLQAFASAYGMAAEGAPDNNAKRALQELQSATYEELKLHDSYAKAWKQDTDQEDGVTAATLEYTSFLLDTAAGKVGQSTPGHAQQVDTGVSDQCRTDGAARLVPAEEGASGQVSLGQGRPGQMPASDSSAKTTLRTIAAMVPCMRLYAFIGQSLVKGLPSLDLERHLYRDWIKTYASAEFEASASKLESLLDQLSTGCEPKLRAELQALYQKAMRLELSFFSGQPLVGCPEALLKMVQPGHVFFASDFDSTCSEEDSSPLIAELAIAAGGEQGSHAKQEKWTAVAEAYMEDYTALLNKYLPAHGSREPSHVSPSDVAGGPQPGYGSSQAAEDAESSERTDATSGRGIDTLEAEVMEQEDPSGGPRAGLPAALASFLGALAAFESEANRRVELAEVLSGVSKAALYRRGRDMGLRTNCAELLARLAGRGVELNIISVCWSRSFIEGALHKALGGDKDGIVVHSNELLYGDDALSTGGIEWNLQGPKDKERCFNVLKYKFLASNPSTRKADLLSVYVGDSLTDILPLLNANVGIVIGSSSTLRRAAEVFDIRLDPLLVAAVELAKSELQGHFKPMQLRQPKRIFSVSSWEEIEALLLGYSDVS